MESDSEPNCENGGVSSGIDAGVRISEAARCRRSDSRAGFVSKRLASSTTKSLRPKKQRCEYSCFDFDVAFVEDEWRIFSEMPWRMSTVSEGQTRPRTVSWEGASLCDWALGSLSSGSEDIATAPESPTFAR